MISESSMTTLLTRSRNFYDDRRGVAAVEFAIVLPFMLALYIGGVELGDGMAIKVKVTDTAHIIADLVTQNSSVNQAALNCILNASSATIAPYASSNLVVTVSEVSTNASGVAKVAWSQSLNGTARSVGQVNISMILGEVSYAYAPNLGYAITGTMNLSDSYYLYPRNSPSIPCSDCAG